MPRSKKPRKPFRPHPIVKPLNVRNAWMIEGDAHAVLLSIEANQVDENHIAMLTAHADIVRRLFPAGTPERTQADTVMRIVHEIKSRPEIRVLSGERVAIQAALQVTIEATRSVSNHELHRAATASLRDMDRLGGAVRVTL